jgi:hypothetical protein
MEEFREILKRNNDLQGGSSKRWGWRSGLSRRAASPWSTSSKPVVES